MKAKELHNQNQVILFCWTYFKFYDIKGINCKLSMQGEYPVPTELKILRVGIALIMGITAIVTFGNFLELGNSIAMLFSVLLLVVAICIIVNQYRSRIIISETGITRVGLFTTTQIAIKDIKGIRTDGKNITIVPVSSTVHNISISSRSIFDEQQELRDWLSSNFTNITKQEQQEELDNVLNNPELGKTEQERSEKLKKAKFLATSYNLGTIGVLLLTLVRHTIYFFPLMLLYPLLSLFIIRTSHGLIRLVASRTSPFANISRGVVISCTFLIALASSRNNLIGYAAFFLPFLLVSLVTGFVFLSVSNTGPKKQEKITLIIALLIGGMYGYGSVRLVNCAYDHSVEERYPATVVSHYTTRGKSTTYHLGLSAWGTLTESEEITVSRGLYERTDLGSMVTVHLKKGLLQIPWFFITPQVPAH